MSKRKITAVAALVLALAGCSSPFTPDGEEFFERAVVPDGEAKLDAAVMAFFVGPQRSEMTGAFGKTNEPGYLGSRERGRLLPRRADHVHGHDETGMVRARPVLRRREHRLPDGNDGNGDRYTNHVAVTTGRDGRTSNVQGNYFTGARCGGEVFGIAENSGSHKAEAPKSPGYTSTVSDTLSPQMLAIPNTEVNVSNLNLSYMAVRPTT